MLYSGTDPESYITECTLAYGEKRGRNLRVVLDALHAVEQSAHLLRCLARPPACLQRAGASGASQGQVNVSFHFAKNVVQSHLMALIYFKSEQIFRKLQRFSHKIV